MTKIGKILYPKYIGFIIVYSCVFLTIGVTTAKLLNKLFPEFEEPEENGKKQKSKIQYYFEIIIQISSIAVITYIFRELIHFIFTNIKSISLYGKPDKYAALIIAPTMFTAQPNLIKKIKYVWNIV